MAISMDSHWNLARSILMEILMDFDLRSAKYLVMPTMTVRLIPMVTPKVKAIHLVIPRVMPKMTARLTQRARSMAILKLMD
jgi:hypothetical protein